MSPKTFQRIGYEELGETWRCQQTARILQRHLQFGQHWRLDLEALLAAAARTSGRRKTHSTCSERPCPPIVEALDPCSLPVARDRPQLAELAVA
jgi:hypothetical protein